MTDYIKREDVIALAWDVTYKNEWHMHEHDEVVSVSDIAEIPSADVVERKRGKWIDPADLICYKCTACGDYANQGYGLDEPIFWDYCPNCGADMRETK